MAQPPLCEDEDAIQAQPKRPTDRIARANGAFVVVVAFVALVFLFPMFSQDGGPGTHRIAALSDMKQINLGLIMYAEDTNDSFPLAKNWIDVTLPYTKIETIYHSRGLAAQWHSATPTEDDPYGIAFRRRLAGAVTSKIKDQEHVALVFDSNDLRRNASGGLDLLPNPGRYGRGGGNYIGFVDGHVKFTRLGDAEVK